MSKITLKTIYLLHSINCYGYPNRIFANSRGINFKKRDRTIENAIKEAIRINGYHRVNEHWKNYAKILLFVEAYRSNR